MPAKTEPELLRLVTEWIARNRLNQGSAFQLADDADFIAEGLLDSVGLIELIVYVENEVGCKIDLADVDLRELTTTRGFCRTVLEATGDSRICQAAS
jgi:acyl carrier protein